MNTDDSCMQWHVYGGTCHESYAAAAAATAGRFLLGFLLGWAADNKCHSGLTSCTMFCVRSYVTQTVKSSHVCYHVSWC